MKPAGGKMEAELRMLLSQKCLWNGNDWYAPNEKTITNLIELVSHALPAASPDALRVQAGTLDVLESLAQWCEQQTGDFLQYFTPENVAAVIRAKNATLRTHKEETP